MDLIWECLRELMVGDHLIRLRDIISSRNSRRREKETAALLQNNMSVAKINDSIVLHSQGNPAYLQVPRCHRVKGMRTESSTSSTDC